MDAIKDTSKKETYKMFDLIASRYDLLNRILSFGIDKWWRYRLGYQLPKQGNLSILDIATGTGDVGVSFLKHQGKRITKIVGVDLSEEMLAKAQEKIVKIDKMTVKVGDATALPIEDNSVDATSIAFGIRNVPDVSQALSEMCRVLKPGGVSLILEFSMPRFFLVRWVYLAYFRYILPSVGGLISGNKEAYSYLNKSVEAFPDGENFAALMRDVGFESVRLTSLSFGIATIYRGEKRA
jgi:demethylmenaquinone methyltransferase / 2-methoxy-6-polyprenyl-1,4-benzoquinol methylase